jgi:hypothetical protein
MSGTITGTVTIPVILGQGGYGDDLKVDKSGAVLPAGNTGRSAIFAPSSLSLVEITNAGTVSGATGRRATDLNGGAGGAGIVLGCAGSINNKGLITGGSGGYSEQATSGAAGTGIEARQSASILNSGTITGGKGAVNFSDGLSGASGVGIALEMGGTLVKKGVIKGASASYGFNLPGAGGAGVVLGANADVANSGTIAGGYGDYSASGTVAGGDALDFAKSGTLTNKGLIKGGNFAGAAVLFTGGADLSNSGTISAGHDTNGIVLSAGGRVENHGVIEGGEHYAKNGHTYTLATALSVSGCAAIGNTGLIEAGVGRAYNENYSIAGGTGVLLSGGEEALTNSGTILGGYGGFAAGVIGGAGGIGLYLGPSAVAANHGTMIGGTGGAGYALSHGGTMAGGVGGDGVYVAGGTLTNFGDITGGAGGRSSGSVTSNGGVGVYLHAGTLIAVSGTISGGASGGLTLDGPAGAAPSMGYAVVLGDDVAATLRIDQGAHFVGGIEASYSVGDRLQLGPGTGSLSGFGQAGGITGFSSIELESNAHWTLTGTITSNTPVLLSGNDVLALNGSLPDLPVEFSSAGNDTLLLDKPLAFAYGTLAHFGSGDAVVLEGIKATAFQFQNDELTLLGSNGGTLDQLYFPGGGSASDFAIKAVAGGTKVLWAGSSSSGHETLSVWQMHLSF